MKKDKFLSREDLLSLELAIANTNVSKQKLDQKNLENQFDELKAINEHLTLQVKAHEITIARFNKRTKFEQELKTLSESYTETSNKYDSLKKEFGVKYQIDDWSMVTYDDITGKLTLIPT